MAEKTHPRVNSEGANELQKAKDQIDAFEDSVKELTLDRMNFNPRRQEEPQTKIAQADIAKAKDIYLKPARAIGSAEKFNEKFRNSYNFDKEYVQFTAENKELIGEAIELWTKPYAGMPAEFWIIPVNKPIWGPRYLAEQIKRKYYHRLKTEDKVVTGYSNLGTDTGMIVVDTTCQRLDANPVSSKRSIFIGSTIF